MTKVKICGLKDSENLHTAIDAGADFIGMVFFEKSPRNVDYHTAANLRQLVPAHVKAVGLFVNPTDEDLQKYAVGLNLDVIQLHGDETPERVGEIKRIFERAVMKAIPIASAADLAVIEKYEAVADWLLFDTKAPADVRGGTGHSFDWNILAGRTFTKPWMLAGGLNAGNVQDALKILKPTAVDVSSGVEKSKGVKDPAKICEFIQAVLS